MLRVAVDAAICLFAAVCEAEGADDLLLDSGDTARVLALDHIAQGLRQLEMQLLFQLAVFDQIDSDVAVDVAEHVEVDIDTVIDLDDVLLAIFRAVRVLNDRDTVAAIKARTISIGPPPSRNVKAQHASAAARPSLAGE